ncbi:MAG TPA: hypothetical protein PK659_10560 [Methanothrix sp.]|nr:hypothetical protein [Methanothrix sp.]HOL44684.1 hypothetical protein [Methanothrix sp.]
MIDIDRVRDLVIEILQSRDRIFMRELIDEVYSNGLDPFRVSEIIKDLMLNQRVTVANVQDNEGMFQLEIRPRDLQ